MGIELCEHMAIYCQEFEGEETDLGNNRVLKTVWSVQGYEKMDSGRRLTAIVGSDYQHLNSKRKIAYPPACVSLYKTYAGIAH